MAKDAMVVPLVGRTKDQGGDYTDIGEFKISFSGVKDKESALNAIMQCLVPEARAAVAAVIAAHEVGGTDAVASAVRLEGDVFTLSGRICCHFPTNSYSWCPSGGICCCNYIGPGCPA